MCAGFVPAFVCNCMQLLTSNNCRHVGMRATFVLLPCDCCLYIACASALSAIKDDTAS
jgi:hypothetical protein